MTHEIPGESTVTSEGWSADPVRSLVHQVLYHLAEHQDDAKFPQLSEIADALDSPESQVEEAAHLLNQQGDAKIRRAISGHMRIIITNSGMGTIARWRSKARDHRGRLWACREAVLDWVYANSESVPTPKITSFQQDLRAFFYGDPFTLDEVISAARYLREENLVTGNVIDGGVIAFPQLAPAGRECVEDFDGDIHRYKDSRRLTPSAPAQSVLTVTGSTNVNISNNSPGTRQDISTITAPKPAEPASDEPHKARDTQLRVALITSGAVIIAAALGLVGMLLSR